jgi:hypothetical protein
VKRGSPLHTLSSGYANESALALNDEPTLVDIPAVIVWKRKVDKSTNSPLKGTKNEKVRMTLEDAAQ